MTIEEMYLQKCNTPSDINQLLPIIREVASRSQSCIEFGVRDPTSTYALLMGCNKVTSYDIERHPNVSRVEALAPNFKFIEASVLDVEIEETDCLLIDTHHKYSQLSAELALHAQKVKKFIVMHDTTTFGFRDESEYKDQPKEVYGTGPGLNKAIEEFLQANQNWRIGFVTQKNNGLTILERLS